MSSRSDPEGRRSASSAWGTHVIVLPGRTPNTVEAMAHGAIAFLEALDLQRVELLGFSIGSFMAQEIALIRPGLAASHARVLRTARRAGNARLGTGGHRRRRCAGTEPAGIPRRLLRRDGHTEGTPARSPRHPQSLVFPMVGKGHAAVSVGLSQWDESRQWRAKVAIHHRPLTAVLASPPRRLMAWPTRSARTISTKACRGQPRSVEGVLPCP
jgi:pimeloyl-ACP methyl ester carboxylesterase